MRSVKVMRGVLGKWIRTLMYLFFLLAELVPPAAGSDHIEVYVLEGSGAILNCSPSHRTDLRSKTFDWKKDGKMEVFLYSNENHYSNGISGQDPQFKGRVSLFEDQLEHGNASIHINGTRLSDSGNYSCIFPRLNSQEERFFVQLVVQPIFRDRSAENRDAVSKIHTEILDSTDAGVPLKCEVHDAFPEPDVWWEDNEGKKCPASEPQISKRGGRYDITITANVTKTANNLFFCVVRQKEISHEKREKIYVPEKMFLVCKDHTWPVIGAGLIGVLIGVPIGGLIGGLIVGLVILAVTWIKKG